MANKAKTWETSNRIYIRNRKGRVTYKTKPKTAEVNHLVSAYPTTESNMNTQEMPKDTIKRLDQKIRELSTQTIDIPYNWPTTTEVDNLIYAIEARVNDALSATKKEGTKQDLELVKHHLKIIRRYFNKALTI